MLAGRGDGGPAFENVVARGLFDLNNVVYDIKMGQRKPIIWMGSSRKDVREFPRPFATISASLWASFNAQQIKKAPNDWPTFIFTKANNRAMPCAKRKRWFVG